MAEAYGNIFADYRIDPITQAELPVDISSGNGELQTVAELLPGSPNFFGFELNEAVELNGIQSVIRVSDSQVFTPSVGAPSTNEYFIDYVNQSPVLVFDAAEDGNDFYVKYYGVGTPMSVKATLRLGAYNRSIMGGIKSFNTYDLTPTGNTYLFAGIAQMRNLTIDANRQIYSNTTNTWGILEIFGNLQIDSGFTLSLGRILLIVHGNITGSGTLAGIAGANGGNAGYGVSSPGGWGPGDPPLTVTIGDGILGTPGGGGGGEALHIICLGEIDSNLTIQTGKGGTKGLSSVAATTPPTSGANALIDYGGAGGIFYDGTAQGQFETGGYTQYKGNGGGGGGIGAGGAASIAGTNGTAPGGGAGAGNTGTTTGGAKNIWIGAGGDAGATPTSGQSGDLFLFSRYNSAPCTVDLAKVDASALDGVANYYELASSTDIFGKLSQVYNYFTKAGTQL